MIGIRGRNDVPFRQLRLTGVVIVSWALVALCWTIPTYWVEQADHPPGTPAPGWGHVLLQMLCMYVPWALLTPLIWRVGRSYSFSARSNARAIVAHLVLGIVSVPIMVLAGSLLALGLFRLIGEQFSFTMLGVLLTSFYCIPTFVALVAIGQRRSHALSSEHDERSVTTDSRRSGAIPLVRLTVRERGRTDIVNISDIDFIDMAGHYLTLHVGPKVHLLRGTMREIEKRLDPCKFVRVHRSTIVQLDRVIAISERKNGDCVLLLRGGAEIPASRSYRQLLADRLGLDPAATEATVHDDDFPVRAKG